MPISDPLENAVEHDEEGEATPVCGTSAGEAGEAAAAPGASPNSSTHRSLPNSTAEGSGPSDSGAACAARHEPNEQQPRHSRCEGPRTASGTVRSSGASPQTRAAKPQPPPLLDQETQTKSQPVMFSKEDLKPQGWDRLVIHPDNKFKVHCHSRLGSARQPRSAGHCTLLTCPPLLAGLVRGVYHFVRSLLRHRRASEGHLCPQCMRATPPSALSARPLRR